MNKNIEEIIDISKAIDFINNYMEDLIDSVENVEQLKSLTNCMAYIKDTFMAQQSLRNEIKEVINYEK